MALLVGGQFLRESSVDRNAMSFFAADRSNLATSEGLCEWAAEQAEHRLWTSLLLRLLQDGLEERASTLSLPRKLNSLLDWSTPLRSLHSPASLISLLLKSEHQEQKGVLLKLFTKSRFVFSASSAGHVATRASLLLSLQRISLKLVDESYTDSLRAFNLINS